MSAATHECKGGGQWSQVKTQLQRIPLPATTRTVLPPTTAIPTAKICGGLSLAPEGRSQRGLLRGCTGKGEGYKGDKAPPESRQSMTVQG